MKKTIFALLFIIFAFMGCKKDDTPIKETNNNTGEYKYSYSEGDLVIGKQLNNPYTISNMTIAYNKLTSEGIIPFVTPNIRVTHYYLRYSPSNIDEYEALKSNKNLVLYDYPLDFEITQGGNRYHDNNLSNETPTYQYVVIKAGLSIPNTSQYQILSELYIPEEDTTLFGSNNGNFKYIELLLDQAYVQTDNYSDTAKYYIDSKGSYYHPGGKILINDTRLNANIGLEGVEVRARRWFTTYIARPDFYGNYRMNGSFIRPCNYSLQFDQMHFSVREHLLGLTAWINGPKITGDWNYTIANGYDRFVGHIFRGAYRYHYKYIDGLQRPFRPSGNRTIYIGKDCAKDWSGINYIVFPILKIARYLVGNTEYFSDEVFSTTIHETAHTSHVIVMNCGAIQYSQVSSILQESWPTGVEWWLTKLEYKYTRSISNYGDYNYNVTVQYPHQNAYQFWNKATFSNDYTSLFIDLTDSHNQIGQTYPGRPNGTTNDQVNGYTFSGIESNILKHSYGLTSLKSELKNNKPGGVTDAQIDLLISYF